MTAETQTSTTTSIDPATQIGPLSLTVANLSRSLRYYTEAIGFELLEQSATSATLGAAGVPLLLLSELPELPGAQPWPRDRRSYTGLYHFAILVPTREDLGRWLRHWLELGFPVPGQGDHAVSEALYLEDPDGNGIEVYRDRPRTQWQHADGRVQMGTGPVDIAGVLADAERAGLPFTGLAAGSRIGHIHLQVGDIADAARFYHDILGFDIMAQMPSALFVSAGGYHHHLGMNIWHSAGQGAAPSDSAGLRFFTVDLPHQEARRAVLNRLEAAGVPFRQVGNVVSVNDPWMNQILLQVGQTESAQGAGSLATAAGESAPDCR